MHDSNHSCLSFFSGAIIGGTLGALAVLLYTTKNGKDILRLSKKTYHDLEEKAEKMVAAVPKKPRSRAKAAAK